MQFVHQCRIPVPGEQEMRIVDSYVHLGNLFACTGFPRNDSVRKQHKALGALRDVAPSLRRPDLPLSVKAAFVGSMVASRAHHASVLWPLRAETA
eukprot:7191511-Alexandrium_andersonii.AAC.1